MFTGIIEHTGMIEALVLNEDGGRITIHAPSVAPSLAVSNSIAVNGCCLTIVDLHNGRLSADLSGETIRKTSFGAKDGELKKGAHVNLEQPLTAGKEFGGHFVLGHVDTIGRVTRLTPEGENRWLGWRFRRNLRATLCQKVRSPLMDQPHRRELARQRRRSRRDSLHVSTHQHPRPQTRRRRQPRRRCTWKVRRALSAAAQ